jgi:hypothetical protein
MLKEQSFSNISCWTAPGNTVLAVLTTRRDGVMKFDSFQSRRQSLITASDIIDHVEHRLSLKKVSTNIADVLERNKLSWNIFIDLTSTVTLRKIAKIGEICFKFQINFSLKVQSKSRETIRNREDVRPHRKK